MRSVEENTHQAPAKSGDNRDSSDPSNIDPTNGPPVGSPKVTVAKRDANGGTSDAHRGGDGDTELRGKDDGDRGRKFHGETARGGVQGDAVTEDTHDVVAV